MLDLTSMNVKRLSQQDVRLDNSFNSHLHKTFFHQNVLKTHSRNSQLSGIRCLQPLINELTNFLAALSPVEEHMAGFHGHFFTEVLTEYLPSHVYPSHSMIWLNLVWLLSYHTRLLVNMAKVIIMEIETSFHMNM